MVKSYARGRRFEYHVVDKLAKHGFSSRRVALSGRQPSPDIPNADIVVEERFLGKAKTTKAKKYVSFPEKEILELENKDLDFLVFNFTRTNPFVVIKFEDFVKLLNLWKQEKGTGSIKRNLEKKREPREQTAEETEHTEPAVTNKPVDIIHAEQVS